MSPFYCLVLLFCVIFNLNDVFSYPDGQMQCKDSYSWAGGCVPSAFCAFHKNGSLNTDIIPSYAEYFVKRGMNTTVIVNDPAFGCDTLSNKEKNKNLFEWIKVSKKYGLNVIAYIFGNAIPDIKTECGNAQRLGAMAVMVRPDIVYRYNSTYLRVEYVKELAEGAYPAPVLVDFYFKRMEDNNDNVGKFHNTAKEYIRNYIGAKMSAYAAMNLISYTEITKCEVILTYDSTVWAPIDDTYMAPMSSYSCSIYPKEIKEVYELVVQNKSIRQALSYFLRIVKKFGVTIRYLNADTYDEGVYPYVEVIMRRLFICVTGLDVGKSRHYGIYKTLEGRDFSSYSKKHEISCIKGDDDNTDDKNYDDDDDDDKDHEKDDGKDENDENDDKDHEKDQKRHKYDKLSYSRN